MIMVNVEWDNAGGIRTLKEIMESVNFPVGEDKEYKDDSNEILSKKEKTVTVALTCKSKFLLRTCLCYLLFVLVKNSFQTYNCLLH